MWGRGPGLGRILAYVTGTVDQELLAWNEYLAAENRILKVQLNGRLKLSDAERAVLGEIGPRLGRQVLADHASETAMSCSASRLMRIRGRATSCCFLGRRIGSARGDFALVVPQRAARLELFESEPKR